MRFRKDPKSTLRNDERRTRNFSRDKGFCFDDPGFDRGHGSLPHFLPLAQIPIIAELTGLERGSSLKLLSTHQCNDLPYRFRKGTDCLVRREIINHLVIFDVVEGCTLRQPAKQISDSEGVEVELDITED